MKGGEDPPQDRLAAEKSHAQRFTIAREQFFLRQYAPNCAGYRTPQHDWKAVVEPDHSCGSRPYKITYSAVVAVYNPAILGEGPRCERSKFVGRSRNPVRLPIERIKFKVRETQHAGERACESGLTDAAGAITTTRVISLFILPASSRPHALRSAQRACQTPMCTICPGRILRKDRRSLGTSGNSPCKVLR
jgi:hypothetical protein